MSYTALHELEIATGVEYCCYGHFFSRDVLHVAIAGGSSLEVYELVNISGEHTTSGFRLRFTKTYDFFGSVQSLATIPPAAFANARPVSDRDALLIAFDYGKFSIVDFDPASGEMQTLEIIDMEDKPYNQSRYRVESSGQDKGTRMSALTTIRIDPEFRCCAKILYDSRLCLFPFLGQQRAPIHATSTATNQPEGLNGIGHSDHRIDGHGEDDFDDTELEQELLTQRRLINGCHDFSLSELGVDGSVMDAVFLNGYFQPTMLILHQPLATGNPILYMRTSSFVATLVTFDLVQGTYTLIWRLDDLPHDSLQLVPVPTGSGNIQGRGTAEGAMLVTTNSIYYLHPRYCSGAHLNGFSEFSGSKLTKRFPVTRYHFGVTLDAARCVFLEPPQDQATSTPAPLPNPKLIVAKSSGLLSVVTLVPNPASPAAIDRLEVAIAAKVTIPCCLCLIGSKYLFVGSRMGDSQLLAIVASSDNGQDPALANDRHIAKKRRLFDPDEDKVPEEEFLYADHDQPASTTTSTSVAATTDAAVDVSNTGNAKDAGVAFIPIDWLECRATGPIVSAVLGNIGHVNRDEYELVAAAGKDKCGALYKVRV